MNKLLLKISVYSFTESMKTGQQHAIAVELTVLS